MAIAEDYHRALKSAIVDLVGFVATGNSPLGTEVGGWAHRFDTIAVASFFLAVAGIYARLFLKSATEFTHLWCDETGSLGTKEPLRRCLRVFGEAHPWKQVSPYWSLLRSALALDMAFASGSLVTAAAGMD